MAKKRLFQVLDDMNQADIENGTEILAVSSNFISIDKVKAGAKLCMGVPEKAIYDMMDDKFMPILIIVDREEYTKRMKLN